MSSWEDPEVDSDSDELLDWLWDVPDRYDVGADEALATEHSEALGVTKRLRRPGEADTIVTPPVAAARPVVDDRPTEAVDPVKVGDPVKVVEPRPAFTPALAPIMFAGERSRTRFSGRDIVAVAGVLLIIFVGLAVGYGLFGGRSSTKRSKPSNLAVGTQTTLPATTPTFDQGAVTVPTDTTTSTTGPTTTTTVAPTTSSVASAIAAATTSTTRHTTTTVAPTTTTYPIVIATVPQGTTTLPPPTTTTTSSTVPPTTTTSSTVLATTSSTSAFPHS